MKGSSERQIWGWQALFENMQWTELDEWWRDTRRWTPEFRPVLRALLVALEDVVPSFSVENGMERTTRQILCSDPQEAWLGIEHLRGAAEILQLGELAAVVERLPPKQSTVWEREKATVEEYLLTLLEQPEPTLGSEEMSRRAHSQDALELLNGLETSQSWMSSELDDQHDREWFSEAVAEVANLAFHAGRHMQAAWGKEFERYAVAKLKSQHAFAHENEGRDEYNRTRRTNAKAWREHAIEVEKAFCSRDLTNSARADRIIQFWRQIGAEEARPSAPSKKTLQNWLSKRKSK